MIHFAWTWLFAVLPLPLLIRWLLPAQSPSESAALKVPFLNDFDTGATTNKTTFNTHYRLWLAVLAWLLLVTAAARPQWLGEPLEQAVSGRDLMLAVDLSNSMNQHDFFIQKQTVDRLTAAKSVANDFINRRIGDRIGLILFGTQAYLQTPLTFDRKTVMTLLDEAVIGLAGDNTAIGDAIGLAVKHLNNTAKNSRVLILVTDGANTAGEVSPLKAAELALAKQLKIYTIGIGAATSMDLDEKTLIKIAETTGGRYFRARNSDELNNIYLLLDQLEPVEKDKQFFHPRSEWFYYPLTLSLIIVAGLSLLKLREL